MNKFRIVILLILMFNGLKADQSIFITPKVAVKMINKKGVLFIALDKATLEIKKSKRIKIDSIFSFDILGRLNCSSSYFCLKDLEKLFSSLDIAQNESIIIYDKSYGIKASALYAVLESIGHQNVKILRGGVKDIITLDPNWEMYNRYLNDLRSLVTLIQQDSNETLIMEYASNINSLEQKVRALKPHLLLQKNTIVDGNHRVSNYVIEKINDENFLSKKDLKLLMNRSEEKESNITVIDACGMMNTLDDRSDATLKGITSLSWKVLIDKEEDKIKSNKALEKLFHEVGLSKRNHHYVYCMSGAEKSLFMMMLLREVGYTKAKAFIGDWNVWEGDISE